MKGLKALVLLVAIVTGYVVARPSTPDAERWRPMLARLHHIEREYADALDENETEELDEAHRMLGQIEEMCAHDGPRGRRYVERVKHLRELVAARAAPEAFEAELDALVTAIVQEEAVVTHPVRVPDVERGKALFATHCAGCHESSPGHKPPAGKLLRPAPVSFFARDVTEHLTPFKVYNLVTHGVPGTPMASFARLSDEERWALAYYVPAMQHPPCEGPGVAVSGFSTKTDRQLLDLVGAPAVACARWRPISP